MREIKFRIWDSSVNRFLKNTYAGEEPWLDESGTFSLTEYSFWTYQQFTGLTDSEGKEIYEGDILEELTNNETVKSLGICKQVLGGWKIFSHPSSTICWHGWKSKIIGNVLESPDLLK